MQARGTEKGREQIELPKLVVSEVAHRRTILSEIARFRRWMNWEILDD
jgi:hypothetical protein